MPLTRSQNKKRKKLRRVKEQQNAQKPPVTYIDHNWLDVLPDEICVRIADYSCKGHKNLTTQQLALVSEKQRRAVVSCFQHKFVEEYSGSDNTTWRKFFIESPLVVEVDLHRLPSNRVSKDHIALLQKSTLRKVTITENPKLFEAVSGSASITDFNVVLKDNKYLQSLLDTLPTLKLQKLSLECEVSSKKECVLGKENKLNPAIIAERCPKLDCIDISCYCDRSLDLNLIFVEGIPSLRETIIRKPLPRHLVRRLSTFNDVKVHAPAGPSIDGILVAKQFPAVITEVVLWGTWLSVEQVRDFGAYPNLKKLRCGLLNGAEAALVEVCRTSPALHTLHLDWEHDSRRERSFYDNFESLVKGTILRLVEAAPMLANLSLSHVKIPTGELISLLTALGSRVEVFGSSTVFQEEDKFLRFMTLVETVIQHNPRLRELHLQNTYTSVQGIVSKRDELRAIAMLAYLRKRQPRLHVPGLSYPLNAATS